MPAVRRVRPVDFRRSRCAICRTSFRHTIDSARRGSAGSTSAETLSSRSPAGLSPAGEFNVEYQTAYCMMKGVSANAPAVVWQRTSTSWSVPNGPHPIGLHSLALLPCAMTWTNASEFCCFGSVTW